MSRYTHIFRGQESEAVAGLADLSLPSREKQKAVATGTDGRADNETKKDFKKSTPKLTPLLTPMAFSDKNRLSQVGTEGSRLAKNSTSGNCLKGGELSTKKDSLSSAVFENKKSQRSESNRQPLVYKTSAVKTQALDKAKTCEIPKGQLTPQLTPKSQKQAEIDLKSLPDDLAEIVTAWPELPEHIKAAIKALTGPHTKER